MIENNMNVNNTNKTNVNKTNAINMKANKTNAYENVNKTNGKQEKYEDDYNGQRSKQNTLKYDEELNFTL